MLRASSATGRRFIPLDTRYGYAFPMSGTDTRDVTDVGDDHSMVAGGPIDPGQPQPQREPVASTLDSIRRALGGTTRNATPSTAGTRDTFGTHTAVGGATFDARVEPLMREIQQMRELCAQHREQNVRLQARLTRRCTRVPAKLHDLAAVPLRLLLRLRAATMTPRTRATTRVTTARSCTAEIPAWGPSW